MIIFKNSLFGKRPQNEMNSRVREAERLMGLKVHQDGVKPPNSLEWRSAVAYMR